MTEALTESRVRDSVPPHWVRATIADTGSYVNGVAFKASDWHEDGLPIIRIQNLTDPDKPFNRTRKDVRAESRVYNGDILVSWSATLDAFCWKRGPAVLNQHIFKVFPNRDVVRDDFLFYLLKEAIAEMAQSAHAHGSTMKHINRGPFLAHEVFIPPLDEQKQIVDEIETQLARLDDAVAALQRARTRLKRYRASVLKAACEGRLVPTEAELARQEGRDYEPASVLLDRIRAAREASGNEKRRKSEKTQSLDASDLPELPDGWMWTTLGDVISEGPQNGLYKPASEYGEGMPILRIDDFQDYFVRTRSDLRRVYVNDQEERSYSLHPGDLVVNRVNSAPQLGKSLVVPEALCPAVFESNMMRARLSECINPHWVGAYLRSTDGRSQLTKNAKWAVNQASINQKDVGSTPLPFPPLPEQERIVDDLDRRMSVIENMEAMVEINLKRTEALRQSILRKAFSGQLVQQGQGVGNDG